MSICFWLKEDDMHRQRYLPGNCTFADIVNENISRNIAFHKDCIPLRDGTNGRIRAHRTEAAHSAPRIGGFRRTIHICKAKV
jgi:hypothetical protein